MCRDTSAYRKKMRPDGSCLSIPAGTLSMMTNSLVRAIDVSCNLLQEVGYDLLLGAVVDARALRRVDLLDLQDKP